MKHGIAGTPEHMAWLKTQLPEMSENPNIRNMELVRLWIADATPEELRTLRAIINGKLGKRTISTEAQAKMQEARKKKERV